MRHYIVYMAEILIFISAHGAIEQCADKPNCY